MESAKFPDQNLKIFIPKSHCTYDNTISKILRDEGALERLGLTKYEIIDFARQQQKSKENELKNNSKIGGILKTIRRWSGIPKPSSVSTEHISKRTNSLDRASFLPY